MSVSTVPSSLEILSIDESAKLLGISNFEFNILCTKLGKKPGKLTRSEIEAWRDQLPSNARSDRAIKEAEEPPIIVETKPRKQSNRGSGRVTKDKAIEALAIGFGEALPQGTINNLLTKDSYTQTELLTIAKQLASNSGIDKQSAIAIAQKDLGELAESEQVLFTRESYNQEDLTGLVAAIQIKRIKDARRQIDLGVQQSRKEMAYQKGKQQAESDILHTVTAQLVTSAKLQQQYLEVFLTEEKQKLEDDKRSLLTSIQQMLSDDNIPMPQDSLNAAQLHQTCISASLEAGDTIPKQIMSALLS